MAQEVFNFYYPIQDGDVTVNGPAANLNNNFNFSGSDTRRHWDGADSLDIGQGKGSGVVGVYAIYDGVVVEERHSVKDGVETPSSGNFIAYKLDESCGLSNAYVNYMHLYPNSAQVTAGARVVKGQYLGLVGDTGKSSGPHLHIHIRQHGWWDSTGTTIPVPSEWKSNNIIYRDDFGTGIFRGVSEFLFHCVQPKKIIPSVPTTSSDVRIACTMALLEAEVLGLIGMEEAVAVAYNRLKYWSKKSMLEVVSAPNQFEVYSKNRILFDSGGYTQEQIESKTNGIELLKFTEGLLKGSITLSNSKGWASDYNAKIKEAFFFNSTGAYSKGNLYKRTKGGFTHWYGNKNVWS